MESSLYSFLSLWFWWTLHEILIIELTFPTYTCSMMSSVFCLFSKHGLVASGKNTLYLAGGEFPDGSASRSMWRYDPILDVWQEMAPMLVPRSELGEHLRCISNLLYSNETHQRLTVACLVLQDWQCWMVVYMLWVAGKVHFVLIQWSVMILTPTHGTSLHQWRWRLLVQLL